MSAENMMEQIQQKRDLLQHWIDTVAEWRALYLDEPGIDVLLEKIKSDYINPDEAFIIGYMLGADGQRIAAEEQRVVDIGGSGMLW